MTTEGKFKGPFERKSKAELIEMLAEMSERIDEVEETLADRDAELVAVKSAKTQEGDSGWLVSTPNPLYGGVTFGVPFSNGRAFVSRRFRFQGLDAEAIVRELMNEFGYEVVEVDAEELNRLRAQTEGMEAEVSKATVQSIPASPYPPQMPHVFGE